MREAWHVVEPGQPYIHGWHIDALCDHLEACSRADILKFLCNMPFWMSKSSIMSVMWSAWEWGPAAMPWLKIVSTSYKEDLTKRDSRRTLDLVSSEWYQRHWGDQVKLERTGESDFSNAAKGSREGVVFRSLTGGHWDRVIIDDPHSTETVESDADRAKVLRVFRESVPSRGTNPNTSVTAIVMQRLHENDVSGNALALDLGYVNLMLPWEYEPDRHCITYVKGKKFWEDPRRHKDELLCPERFDRAKTEEVKKSIGAHATASQMQQRPAPREGKLFKRAWFEFVKAAPSDCRWVRYWDLAASEDREGADPDWSVGMLLGYSASTGFYYIKDVRRVREEAPGVTRLMKTTATGDGLDCHLRFPQDPGSAGKTVAKNLVKLFPGYTAGYDRETGSKVVRAEAVAVQAEQGLFKIVKSTKAGEPDPDWIAPLLDEIEKFPASTFKDQVDALSGAYSYLLGDAVFNASEDAIKIEGRRIPGHWKMVYGFDVDKDRFAAVWGAFDPQSDVLYIVDEYRVVPADLAIHKEAIIRRRGAWVPGLFDEKARGRTKKESVRIVERMLEPLDIYTVEMDDEAGITEMQARLSTGRIKVFDHLTGWFGEYRQYQRDDKGEAADVGDHLMKITAMLVTYAHEVAKSENMSALEADVDFDDGRNSDSVTGY